MIRLFVELQLPSESETLVSTSPDVVCRAVREAPPQSESDALFFVPKSTGFLNVDLEIGAPTRAALAPLIDELRDRLFELYVGRSRSLYRAHYELSGCAAPTADATINALARTIESLEPAARRAWKRASMREFNIGVELERGIRSVELGIREETLRRVVSLGGTIGFTAYQVAAMSVAKPR